MKNRKEFFGGNWKMNKTLAQAKDFFAQAEKLQWPTDKEAVIFTPSHLLLSLKQSFPMSKLALGAQNYYHEKEGAFTGEISAWMLAQEGFSYAIIGHSERRQIFKEDLELIEKKVLAGIDLGLSVILCVGETLEEREQNRHFDLIASQLDSALKNLPHFSSQKLIIAYEPVWAIGTGKTASPEQAQEIHAFIRNRLEKRFGGLSQEIRIIYGGSMKPENVGELMTKPDIDGGLIGGASLKADSFHSMVQSV